MGPRFFKWGDLHNRSALAKYLNGSGALQLFGPRFAPHYVYSSMMGDMGLFVNYQIFVIVIFSL